MSAWIGAKRGFLAACANLLICAIWIATREHDQGAIPLIMMYGFLPAIITGMCVGGTVGSIPHASPIVRLPVLVLPAFAMVAALGYGFELKHYISGAMLPTMLCCVWLERWTYIRAVKPAELPTARVA
ncbi:MAG TPA: hypothetical protein VGM90_28120 [Kofleriaceae bacterium]|jgi:hypothetical protein